MNNGVKLPAAVVALALLVSGCTAEQVYNTGQSYQRNRCYKSPDASERERCLNETSKGYDEYRRETNP